MTGRPWCEGSKRAPETSVPMCLSAPFVSPWVLLFTSAHAVPLNLPPLCIKCLILPASTLVLPTHLFPDPPFSPSANRFLLDAPEAYFVQRQSGLPPCSLRKVFTTVIFMVLATLHINNSHLLNTRHFIQVLTTTPFGR